MSKAKTEADKTKVLYVSFEHIPGPTGTSAWITEELDALSRRLDRLGGGRCGLAAESFHLLLLPRAVGSPVLLHLRELPLERRLVGLEAGPDRGDAGAERVGVVERLAREFDVALDTEV